MFSLYVNSLTSALDEQSQKSLLQNQVSISNPLYQEPSFVVDREATLGFSHVFDRTINFNDIQNRRENARSAGFEPFFKKEEIIEQSHKIIEAPIQNLKILSKKVYKILVERHSITYKQIMEELLDKTKDKYYIEYEQKDNHNKESKQNNNKEIKQDNHNKESKQSKNMRRRLYDTINVLFAASVIQKNKMNFHLKIYKNNSLIKNKSYSKNICDEQQLTKLKLELSNKKQALQNKKKYYQILLSKLLLIKKLVQRNKSEKYKKNIKENIINLPLLFIETPINSKVIIQQKQICIKTQIKNINLVSDLDILEYLFFITKTQIIDLKKQMFAQLPQNFIIKQSLKFIHQ